MSDQMQYQAEVMERKLREIDGVLRDQQKEKDLIVSRVQEEYKQLEQLQNEQKELSQKKAAILAKLQADLDAGQSSYERAKAKMLSYLEQYYNTLNKNSEKLKDCYQEMQAAIEKRQQLATQYILLEQQIKAYENTKAKFAEQTSIDVSTVDYLISLYTKSSEYLSQAVQLRYSELDSDETYLRAAENRNDFDCYQGLVLMEMKRRLQNLKEYYEY